MITLRIRWRVLLAPLCRLLGHSWQYVEGVTAFDDTGYHCRRCAWAVSLNRCTCGHHRSRHHQWLDTGLRPVGIPSWCMAKGCSCAALVSEAYEAGAAPSA